MSILTPLWRCLPSGLRAALRPHVRQLRIAGRRIAYGIRFAGLNVRIHPTARIGRKAIIRCTGGGEIVIGAECEIHDFAMIDAMRGSVRMGAQCSLNPFAIIYGQGTTTIGNHVRIAAHSVIIPANHSFHAQDSRHKSGETRKGITIGDDVWLGAGVRILDGVTVGSRSVIGAGAVVTRSIPSGCVATGVPARAVPITAPDQPTASA